MNRFRAWRHPDCESGFTLKVATCLLAALHTIVLFYLFQLEWEACALFIIEAGSTTRVISSKMHRAKPPI